MDTVIELAHQLAAGRTTSTALTDAALARAQEPNGEGARVFTLLLAEEARAEAAASDRLRAAGIVPSALAGLPISIKDMLDVRGYPTTAGSPLLKTAPPASVDAVIVSRLRQAGAVIVGRTNMPEFACSSTGVNARFGTPRNVWNRKAGCVPGGSSAGAAISVTDGMAVVGIGSDTGGSIRIPAALNGIVGFKPTARRVPLAGCHPLSQTYDSLGPIAASVACCAIVDAVLTGREPVIPAALALDRISFALPRHSFFFDALDPAVATAFEAGVTRLSRGGARIVDVDIPELGDLAAMSAAGGVPTVVGKSPLNVIIGAEAYATHRLLVQGHEADIDPMALMSLTSGKDIAAADYIDMLKAQAAIIAAITRALAGFCAFLIPTISCVAPEIASVEASFDAYLQHTIRISRNTSPINVLDACGLTLPCHEPGSAPVGISLIGVAGSDLEILAAGIAAEGVLRAR